MVTAFNEIIKHSRDNSKIERVQDEKGISNKFGTLAKTSVDDRAVESLKRALDQSNSDVEGSRVRIFADLGITTERDGTLKFNEQTFMKAVADDPSAVDKLIHGFADRVASTSGIVAEYTKFQGVIDSAVDANDEEMKRINDKLLRLDESLERQQQTLKLVFAKLEENMARLNSNADALTSLFSSNKK
jgi:flagellar hook-associated protein 2